MIVWENVSTAQNNIMQYIYEKSQCNVGTIIQYNYNLNNTTKSCFCQSRSICSIPKTPKTIKWFSSCV